MYEFHDWFLDAYDILTNSKTESGRIPLSELKIFSESFGLICGFKEFVEIIYAIDSAYNEYNRRKKKI